MVTATDTQQPRNNTEPTRPESFDPLLERQDIYNAADAVLAEKSVSVLTSSL
jgi:hypothetical protein